jgi:hypothetical protein
MSLIFEFKSFDVGSVIEALGVYKKQEAKDAGEQQDEM